MRRIFGFILIFISGMVLQQHIHADSKDIVVMEEDTPYSMQTMFSSGTGNGLQENYIRQYWDMGYRITSLAYGASGWFVVMSTASGYTGQSYNHVKDWPSLWIDEMWGKGYRLTDFAYGNGMWTVVMSQGTSIDSQKWETCRVGDLKEKTTGWWDMGYHISGVACTGPDSWLVSVSDNMPYSAQAWTVCDSIESAKETIYEYWEQGYNLSALVYGDNRYFILVSKHVSGTNPKQWYIIDNKTPLDQIKVQWDENLRITCAGGGTDYLDANDDTGYTAPRNNNFLPGFGEKIMLQMSDGYPSYIEIAPLYFRDETGQVLYYYSNTGMSSCRGFSGFCYRHDYDEDGYHVLKYYYYSLSGPLQNPVAKLIPSGNDDSTLRVSMSDGSITNSHGVVWSIPIDEEQAAEIRKASEKIARWLDNATSGGYIPPASSQGGDAGNGNGSSASRKSRCSFCNGTGVCRSCNGRGGYFDYYGYSSEKTWRQCPSCNGSGRCFNCYGKGHL